MSRSPAGDHFAALELVKKALHQGAQENLDWARENLRGAMSKAGRDFNQLSALTGLSIGTIRGFLREKDPADSTVRNVVIMALGLGVSASDLFLPPQELLQGNVMSDYQQLAAENEGSVVSVRDVNGDALYVSPSALLIGYRSDELMQLSPEEALALVHPDDRQKVAGVLGEVIASEGLQKKVSYLLRTKSGALVPRESTFWVERGPSAGQILIQVDSPASS